MPPGRVSAPSFSVRSEPIPASTVAGQSADLHNYLSDFERTYQEKKQELKSMETFLKTVVKKKKGCRSKRGKKACKPKRGKKHGKKRTGKPRK